MKITRRKLAASLAASAAAAHARTQTEAQAGPDAELQAARERIRASGEALSKLDIPMATEPAFQFKP